MLKRVGLISFLLIFNLFSFASAAETMTLVVPKTRAERILDNAVNQGPYKNASLITESGRAIVIKECCKLIKKPTKKSKPKTIIKITTTTIQRSQ